MDAVGDQRIPTLGGPLPLELANTTYAVRGQVQDGLQTPARLADWLGRVRTRLQTPLVDVDLAAVDHTQLRLARDLRECIRELAEATRDRKAPGRSLLMRVNRHAAAGLHWNELRWHDGPSIEVCTHAPPVTAALSEIAQETVTLFSSSQRLEIRQCGAPGCVLLFVKDHPRRAWCSTTCGNRVRAARHYERTRKQPS